ncbi:MAG: FHA domain-containing protein [Anaerolineales bacterium]|nr:FHA domain-containing protein [Anaerolineales bacterium]
MPRRINLAHLRSALISPVISLLLCLLLLPVPASAQGTSRADLGAPDLENFPQVEAYLDVDDGRGGFIKGLQTDHVRIIEDGNILPITELIEMNPGVQFVTALNPGPALGVRDNQGVSRYDFVKQHLAGWASNRMGSTLDDLSLIITGGKEISHTPDPAEWLEVLQSDQVNARSANPSLDTLFRAVNLASDVPPRPGMSRVVLFITPAPDTQASQALESLISQAQQQGVVIYVWMVSSAGTFPTVGMKRLTDLAEQTGGQILTYSGAETLPDPEEFLASMRRIYQLRYQSAIRSSGDHQVIAQVQIGVEQFESSPKNFTLELLPPQPAFVNPPIEILRKAVILSESQPATGTNTGALSDQENSSGSEPLAGYEPKEQSLQVVFDFPDGRKRTISRSALLVDGVIVAENIEPPYDQFAWNVESYLNSGTHQIQVQAWDSLGLVGSSIELPVRITVEKSRLDVWAVVRRNLPILIMLAVLLTGAILLLVLVLGGQLRPGVTRAGRQKRRGVDPVTEPVVVQEEPASSHRPGWVNRLQWPQRHITPKAYAFLSKISEADEPSDAPPMPISTDEVTLGSNPNQVTLVLDDPSIEPLHARLVRSDDGAIRLSDEGSIAGTWINYAPVSQSGMKLEHGDLIHIGRVGFRFTLRKPGKVRKPVVTLQTLAVKSAAGEMKPDETDTSEERQS